MSHTRVQISGFGCITPLGKSLKQFEQSIYSNTAAAKKLELHIAGQPSFFVPVASCDFNEKLSHALKATR